MHGEDERIFEEAARWVQRAGAGLSPSEQAELRAWLAERPEHAAAADAVSRAWAAAPAAAERAGLAPRPAAPARVPARRWVPAAAAFAGLAVVAFGSAALWQANVSEARFAAEGARRMVALADGSRAWLAPHSAIQVRVTPIGRSVRLEGQAAFEVDHELRPFQVDAGGVRIVDRGTLFAVRARLGMPVSVVLAHGSVAVLDGASGATLAVPAPNQRVDIAGGAAHVVGTDAEAELAWRDGRVVLVDRPLGEALALLAEQGAPHVALADPALAKLRVSGVFAAGEIESFLDALSAVHPVAWRRTAAGYEVRHR